MVSRLHPLRVEPAPGQESVWDYPRPPRLEASSRTVIVRIDGVELARTAKAFRVLETSHPPTWYLPQDDIDMSLVRRSDARGTICEWKGAARYWDVSRADGSLMTAVGWSYPDPNGGFEAITDHLSFYPARLECEIDGEAVRPQEGGFYGGWVTDEIVGPFKGAPGTLGW